MRVLLVQPDWQQEDFGFRLAAMPEPLGLEMLAAALDGHDVRILDLRCGDDLSAEVQAFKPDLVGVTALTPEVYAAADVLHQVKQISPDIFTLVGGHHASLLPQDFYLPYVDAIILGEGEPILAKLVAALEGKGKIADIANLSWRDSQGQFISHEGPLEEINLDSLAFPRRDLTARHREKYFFLFDQPDTSMATGRGCPYRCNFCSVWEFYKGKTRMMSPARVISELKTITTDHITFVDDNFLLNYRRENEIADMIRAEGIQRRYSMECRTDSIVRRPELVEKWVKTGLYAILLGLEGCDSTLKSVGKQNSASINDHAIKILQDNGVVIWGAFLVDPSWEVDDFKRLREYVTSRGITHTQFTVLTPLPGTELHRQRHSELLTNDYTCFDALHAVTPTRLPREEFYRHFAELYKQNDLRPYYDLVQSGKLTIPNMKRGKKMLTAMSNWENYIINDPVLGQRAKSKTGNGSYLSPTTQRSEA